MNAPGRSLLPLVLLFTLVAGLVFIFYNNLKELHTDPNVLLAANALLFIISLISFFIQRKGMLNPNPHAFVRSVMAGMMFKMIVCIIGVITYVYMIGTSFSKRAIFIALFLYLIYLATEVLVVMKMNKYKKTNA